MPINTSDFSELSPAEKLELVEFLWDDLGNATAEIPLPDWVEQETKRRREEMNDPSFGNTHTEVWNRVERRNG